MDQYVALDVSLQKTAVCVLNLPRFYRSRVPSEPAALIAFIQTHADILAAYVLNLSICVLWLRPRGNRACETESRTHQHTLIDILAHSVPCGTLTPSILVRIQVPQPYTSLI